jgi:beta-lactamase class A
MTMRPQPSLHRVLDDLGATLLELVCAPSVPGSGEIGGVAIHDPVDEPVLPRRALVLGVGVHQPPDVAALLVSLGRHEAAGLVLRSPVTVDRAVAAAVESSGVPLLALTRGASWTQLAALLRSLLAEGDVGDDRQETLGGMPSGDLFSVANAVAALIDAPVTIEDRSSRVLAFSGRQDEADRSRVETILGRQVPERYSRLLVKRGVFRELYRSDEPVYIEPPSGDGLPDFALPRAAVAVRAGDEVLGSIWAAVREPLTPGRARAMGDAARLVALHLLRIRAGADVSRRLRADLVSTALEGGTGAFEAVRRLGLAEQPVVVLALAVADPAERARVADALAMHLSAIHPRCAAALVGDVAYGLIPVVPSGPVSTAGGGGADAAAGADGADGELRAVRIATGFLDRVGDRSRPVIGIGQVASDAAALPAARACADRVLRVLRATEGPAAGGAAAGNDGRRVARLGDVHAEALLMELRDLAAAHGDRPTGPVARLSAYDAEHGTNLVETLRAWLDAFGDVAAASAAMYVHANTFRYRLRRLTEVSGIDLTDPDQRFAAMLQLRAVHRSLTPTGAVHVTVEIKPVFDAAGAEGFLHAREVGAPGGPEAGLGADEPVVLASVFKIAVAVAYAREADAGRLDTTARTTVNRRYRTGGIGTAGCADDVEMSWRDLALNMMVMSDNAATDVIYHRVGRAAVDRVLADLALARTRVIGCCEDLFASIFADLGREPGGDIDDALAELTPAQIWNLSVLNPGRTSASTPRDITTLLDAIWTDRAASPEACRTVRDIMARQIWPHRMTSGFPADVAVAAKTGSLPSVRNECGVVTYPDGRQYAVAVFTRARTLEGRQPKVDASIGTAARLAVDHLRSLAGR